MDEQIEKPWAVYSSGFGKVTGKNEEGKILITSFETDTFSWAPKEVETFKTSIQAINYFFANQPYNPPYAFSQIASLFLDQFPSETKNLETALRSLSSPKLTPQFRERAC